MDALANSGVERRNLAHRRPFGAMADLVLVVSRRSFSGGDDLVVVLVWLRQIVMSYMQGMMMSTRKRHMEGPFPRSKSPNFGGSFMQ
jgi:hypothetical protein